MKQFILNKEPLNGFVQFKGDDFRYLVRVRRLAVGECFPALLPNGEETLVQVVSIEGNVLTGKCVSDSLNPSSSPARLCEKSSELTPPIILFQAMPKGDKMDLILRQAAEGGITEIVPFISEFSIGKANVGVQKYSRWERIIKEARQQSGSKIATTLGECLTINELFEYWQKLKTDENALGLLFHHQKGLEQKSLHEYLNSVPKTVVLVIGPEGGFSDKEVLLFMENGFKPLTVGNTILRTETAALYCAAAVRILLLEKNSWELKKT